MAVGVAEDLDLDVAGRARRSARRSSVSSPKALAASRRAAARASGRAASSSRTIRMPLPPPPADALTQHREAELAGLRPPAPPTALPRAETPGITGTPAAAMISFASILLPIVRMASAGGPMKTSPASAQRAAKSAFSAEEAVARDGRRRRPRARAASRMRSHAEVRLAARRGADAHRLVGLADVRRGRVGVGVDGDAGDAHRAQRPQHAPGDLAAVGHQHLSESVDSRRPHVALTSRNTPPHRASVVPRRRPEWTADSAMPSTVRVSRGSMMPSSHTRPVAKKAYDSLLDLLLAPGCRSFASASSSKGCPARSAAWRRTIDSTPASCSGPITAMRWLGQVNRKRGS